MEDFNQSKLFRNDFFYLIKVGAETETEKLKLAKLDFYDSYSSLKMRLHYW